MLTFPIHLVVVYRLLICPQQQYSLSEDTYYMNMVCNSVTVGFITSYLCFLTEHSDSEANKSCIHAGFNLSYCGTALKPAPTISAH